MCDQVSDAIVDACIKVDPACRVAMETASKSKTLCLLGEVSVKEGEVDFEAVARKAVNDIGFNSWEQGMNGTELTFVPVIEAQDANIANAVIGTKKLEDIGAGDQGIMFGYATNEYD
jgi:S-adenosylmethionine synthetase